VCDAADKTEKYPQLRFLRGCGFVYTARCGEDDACETLEKMRGDIDAKPALV
jgi:hypothetical protein